MYRSTEWGYTEQQVINSFLRIPPLEVTNRRLNICKHEYRDKGSHDGHCDLPEAEATKRRISGGEKEGERERETNKVSEFSFTLRNGSKFIP